MAETAFQPDAFQNNAFQILFGGGDEGGAGSTKTKPSRRLRVFITEEDEAIKELQQEYETVVNLVQDEKSKKDIIFAVDPYIEPLSKEELERRLNAALMLDVPPPANRIDFDNLYLNIVARMRFMDTLKRIKIRIDQFRERQQEEDAVIMLLLLGI